MSASDVDFRKLAKVLILGGLVWALAFLFAWSNGTDAVASCKLAIGYAVVWIIGNLQETGVALSLEGLRK